MVCVQHATQNEFRATACNRRRRLAGGFSNPARNLWRGNLQRAQQCDHDHTHGAGFSFGKINTPNAPTGTITPQRVALHAGICRLPTPSPRGANRCLIYEDKIDDGAFEDKVDDQRRSLPTKETGLVFISYISYLGISAVVGIVDRGVPRTLTGRKQYQVPRLCIVLSLLSLQVQRLRRCATAACVELTNSKGPVGLPRALLAAKPRTLANRTARAHG